MKAIYVSSFGSPDVLKIIEVASPSPDEGYVLIDIKAAGVGTVDVMFRKGTYPGVSTPGFIPGIEVAGIVSAVGHGVDQQWLGKKVFALVQGGGYAEQVSVRASSLVFIPDELTFNQVISLGVNTLVAYFSLQQAGLQSGDCILVRGAGGGIGLITTQLALLSDLAVTAETSSAIKAENIKHLGARILSDLKDVATDTYQAIFDPVAGSELDPYVNLLCKNGRYLLLGAAGGFPKPDFGMSWLSRFQKSLSFHAMSLSSVDEHMIKDAMLILFDMVIHSKIKPVIDKTFQFEEAAEAHRYLESGEAFGKIILSR